MTLSAALISPAGALAAEPWTLVVCAPGYPGSTEQAQSTMDDLARTIGESAGWGTDRLRAVYHETLEPGLDRLEQVGFVFQALGLAGPCTV